MSWFKSKKKSSDEQLFEAALYGDEDWITSHWDVIRLNDVDFVDVKGERMFHLKDFTPLIAAASSGHARLVKFFMEVGGDINRATENGWTPLIFAVQNNEIEVIEFLLSQPGLKINHTDTMGRTALHWAAQDKKLDTLKLLLAHPDIDVAIKNRMEKTAEDSVGSVEGLKIFCSHRGVDPTILDNPESASALPIASAPVDLANITSMSDHLALKERVTTQEQNVLQLTALLEQSEKILQDEIAATEQRFTELSAAVASKRNGSGALDSI